MKAPNQFVSQKQLAARYGIHPNTLRKELKLIKGLKRRRWQKYFNFQQLYLIFKHLGSPED